jgi:hypothetical protein
MKEFGWTQSRQYLKERRSEDEQYSADWSTNSAGTPMLVAPKQMQPKTYLPIRKVEFGYRA